MYLCLTNSALLHLATLVTTHMHDNREKGPQASKLASALSSVTSGILLRSYLFSMLLAIKPITGVVTDEHFQYLYLHTCVL